MILEINSSVIENAIKEDFRKNFNPQTPRLDYELESKQTIGHYKLDFIVPYSTSLINIYDNKEISCKCGVLDVDLIILNDKKPKSLSIELLEIEEELTEDFLKESNEPDDRLTIAKDYQNHM